MYTPQDWFICLFKLHSWAYFHWMFFSCGNGKKRVIPQLLESSILRNTCLLWVDFSSFLCSSICRWWRGDSQAGLQETVISCWTFTAKNHNEKGAHKSIPLSNWGPNETSLTHLWFLLLITYWYWTLWNTETKGRNTFGLLQFSAHISLFLL